MVMTLAGSDGLAPLRDQIAEQWLAARATGTEYPKEKLDGFLNLYEKLKRKLANQGYSVKGTQDASVKKLNCWRNTFIHYLPMSNSIEVSGFPKICLDALNLTAAIVESHGPWTTYGTKERFQSAVTQAVGQLTHLDRRYRSPAV
jgi:hypothetical protein